jgi:alpha-tubulin suppressor-like RCC1 family protein
LNYYGQLGDGTTTSKFTPVQITALSGITELSLGGEHTLALKSDGTVWAWGYNNYGQLGRDVSSDPPINNSDEYSAVPVQVPGLANVKHVAAGYMNSIALKADGTVWAWGDNQNGQLCTSAPQTVHNPAPAKVNGISGAVAIATSQYQGWHTIALKSDGTVWGWGPNYSQQLGGDDFFYTSPQPIPGLTSITAIAAGGSFNVALMEGGKVVSLGGNYWGQLGQGLTPQASGDPDRQQMEIGYPAPAFVKSISDIASISASFEHSAAIRNDGTVYTWGGGSDGELGDGSTGIASVPVAVRNP